MPIISSISCMILERELGIIMHNNLSTHNGPLSWTGRSSVEELLGGVAQLHSSAHARASFAMQSRASLHREHFLSATDHPDSDKDYRRQSPVNLHMQKDLSIWPRPTLLPSYMQSAQVRRTNKTTSNIFCTPCDCLSLQAQGCSLNLTPRRPRNAIMHSSFQALRRPELLLTQRSYSLFLFVDLNEQFRLAPPDTSWPLHDGKKLFQRTSTIVQIIRTKRLLSRPHIPSRSDMCNSHGQVSTCS